MSDHAIVESPLQFITAVEALRNADDAVIHWRGDAKGMTAFMDAYRTDWLPPGVRTDSALPDLRTLSDGALLLGDLCSGRIQKQLADSFLLRYLPPITILDDGLSTIAVVRQLMTGNQPVQRPRTTISPLRLPLSAFVSSRLRGLARKGRLSWFTALVTDDAMLARVRATGIVVTTHDFEHVRSLDAAEVPSSPTVVIGSAMAVDGLVEEKAYRSWVEDAAQDSPITYYPHRREEPRFLASLARSGRIHVEQAGLPLELRLSTLPAGTRVHSLPSTAAFSLAAMNPDATITVQAVPQSWWLPGAPQAFRVGSREIARDLGAHGLVAGGDR